MLLHSYCAPMYVDITKYEVTKRIDEDGQQVVDEKEVKFPKIFLAKVRRVHQRCSGQCRTQVTAWVTGAGGVQQQEFKGVRMVYAAFARAHLRCEHEQ